MENSEHDSFGHAIHFLHEVLVGFFFFSLIFNQVIF